jgi:hypothetical protein
MKKQLKNPFKNAKIKAFLFFLVLATFFWILTKFSKQYAATTDAIIEYTNVPESMLLTDENLKEISFDITTNGFEFLFYQFDKPKVSIDISEYFEDGKEDAVVPKNELIKLISSQLKSNLAVKNLSANELIIKLDAIKSKKVPIIVHKELQFKNGFRAVDSIWVKPDSVIVAGPSEFLEKVNSIGTVLLVEKGIEKSISRTISLQNPEKEKLSMVPKEVVVSLAVAEFSQNELILPVEVVGVPENTIIKLIPKVITIMFEASVDNFKGITKSDFRVVCNYEDRNKEENFMIPKLAQQPKGVFNVEFDTDKIDYLIFK